MRRSLRSEMSLRRIITITMAVVMLSRMAERKNVRMVIRHSRARLLLVFIMSRTKLKPPYWSTVSTIVIAPMRKNSVVAVLPRWPSMAELAVEAMSSGDIPMGKLPGSNM